MARIPRSDTTTARPAGIGQPVATPLAELADATADELLAWLEVPWRLDASRSRQFRELAQQAIARALARSMRANPAYLTELLRQVLEPGFDSAPPPRSGAEEWLTTTQAARKLGVSRPYVSTLCDIGRIRNVVRTQGGQRRIPASELERYTRDKQPSETTRKAMAQSEAMIRRRGARFADVHALLDDLDKG